jgi:hypothetical protein
MPTEGERLATLEAAAARNRELIDALHDEVHGGPRVAWPQSVRGRLHHMQSAIEAADKLADATRQLADQRQKERRSRLTRWQWLYLAACATLAAAAPYVILLLH